MVGKMVLRRLGLNQYEADAYIALLGLDSGTAAEVSKQSTVPYGKIYESLYGLESKGFVIVEPGVPKRYKAIEAERAMFGIVIKQEEGLAELRKDVKRVAKQLSAKEPIGREETMWVVHGKENAIRVRIRDYNSIKKTYDVVVSPAITTPAKQPTLREDIKKAKNRGVKMRYIRTLANKEERNKVRFELKIGCKVRIISYDPGITFGVMDKTSVRLELKDAKYGWVNIYIQNKALAETFTEYFESMWKRAKPIIKV